MNPTDIRDWIQVVLSSCTFLAVIVAGIKVINIAQKGIESHERRIIDLEQKQMLYEAIGTHVTALSAKMEVILQEMERMRNRLDRFLDTQSNSVGGRG